MPSPLLAQMFHSLVTQVGGYDAACAAIEAATGDPVSKGTISRIQNGHALVPAEWMYALEDATGNLAFHRRRCRTLTDRENISCASAYILSGEASKEGGEAVSAGIRAETSASAEDWSTAAVEAREAEAKFGELATLCERKAQPTSVQPIKHGGAA